MAIFMKAEKNVNGQETKSIEDKNPSFLGLRVKVFEDILGKG